MSLLTREFQDQPDRDLGSEDTLAARDVPPGVDVYEIDGPFFFGAAEFFKTALGSVARKPRVLVIRMRRVPAIDSTGLAALRDAVHRSRKEGTLVVLAEVHSQPVVGLLFRARREQRYWEPR